MVRERGRAGIRSSIYSPETPIFMSPPSLPSSPTLPSSLTLVNTHTHGVLHTHSGERARLRDQPPHYS